MKLDVNFISYHPGIMDGLENKVRLRDDSTRFSFCDMEVAQYFFNSLDQVCYPLVFSKAILGNSVSIYKKTPFPGWENGIINAIRSVYDSCLLDKRMMYWKVGEPIPRKRLFTNRDIPGMASIQFMTVDKSGVFVNTGEVMLSFLDDKACDACYHILVELMPEAIIFLLGAGKISVVIPNNENSTCSIMKKLENYRFTVV